MKAKEVLKKFKITRTTLKRYVDAGDIKKETDKNGKSVYNRASVEEFLKKKEDKAKEKEKNTKSKKPKEKKRKTVIYCREISNKKKLESQQKFLVSWCKMQDIEYDSLISEMVKMEELHDLISLVYKGEIENIIIYSESTIGSNIIPFFKFQLEQNKCKLIIVNNTTVIP